MAAMRQTTREAAADEYRAWLDDGEDGSPYLRAVEWLHPVGPNMERVIVTVLEGPWRGPTGEGSSRHVGLDNTKMPPPLPAAGREGQVPPWGVSQPSGIGTG